jgi:hypothetical protein
MSHMGHRESTSTGHLRKYGSGSDLYALYEYCIIRVPRPLGLGRRLSVTSPCHGLLDCIASVPDGTKGGSLSETGLVLHRARCNGSTKYPCSIVHLSSAARRADVLFAGGTGCVALGVGSGRRRYMCPVSLYLVSDILGARVDRPFPPTHP